MDSRRNFSIYDYIVLSFMLVISAAIGIFYAYRGRKKQTTADYLLGGRKMFVIPTAISAMATVASGNGLLGFPAEIYRYGTQLTLLIVNVPIFTVVAAYGYLPVIYELGVTSAFEYLEKRFSKVVRSLASTVFCVGSMMFMAVYIYAPSLALSHVTGIDLWTCIASVAGVATFYTYLGGLKAVIWTDVFQAVIMFVSIFAVLGKGIYDEGGLGKVWEANMNGQRIEFFNTNTDPKVRYTFWSATIGYLPAFLAAFATNPLLVQRYVSVPSLKHARRVIYVNSVPLTIMMVLCILLGLISYSRYQHCDPLINQEIGKPDELLPLLVMDTLGEFQGLPGLFVAGLLSASLSSVSSMQNTLSSLVLEDFVKVYLFPNISDVASTRVCRVLVLFIGGVGLAGVWLGDLVGEGLFQITSIIYGIVPTPIFGLFTLGMFFPWANTKGALVGYISGIIFVSWAGFGTYVAKPYIPKLPVSIEGCIGNATNATLFLTTLPSNGNVFGLYLLSFVWYGPIGVAVIIVVGLVISFFTDPNSASTTDPTLLSPFYHKLAKLLKLSGTEEFKSRGDDACNTLLADNCLTALDKRDGIDYIELNSASPMKS